MAIQTATNPNTGEKVALVDGEWQPVLKTATHSETGAKAYLIGDKWLETEPPAKAEKKEVPQEKIPSIGEDLVSSIKNIFTGKPSVLEGRNLGAPQVDPELNRQAMLQSGSPESVMFTPGREKQKVDQQLADYKAKQAQEKARKDKLAQAAHEENYGVTDFAKDTGLDVAKGVVDLGQSYVGLLDLTSGGAAGRVLEKAGYDPEKTNQFLTGFQSLTRKNADQKVKDAVGFVDTLKALAVNPTSLIGGIAESLPGTVLAGATGGRFVRFLVGKAATEATALGLEGKAAQDFITNKIKDQTVKIATVSGAGEGAQSTGQIAEQARAQGRDWNEYVLPALGAGFGTVAIAALSGGVAKKLGIGDVETNIAARSAGISNIGTGEGPFLIKALKEAASEGLLQEMPQSAQEQIFTNLATGKPWDEGVGQQAAQGLVTGMAMAGGHATTVQLLQSTAKAFKPEEQPNAEDIARSKGFLVPERTPQEQQQVQQEQQANAPAPAAPPVPPPADQTVPTAPGIPPLQTSTAETEPTTTEEDNKKIEEFAKQYVYAGVSEDSALKMAKKKLDREKEKEKEEQNVGTPVTTPSGVSPAIPSQPSAGTTTGELGGTQPTRVVHPATDVGQPNVGEAEQPPAVETEEQITDIPKQVQRYEEPGVGRATTDKPHGIYTTPANVESPHKDLGGDQHFWDVNPKANVLDVTPFGGPDVAMRKNAVNAGAGVAAAKSLLGADTFNKLKKLNKEDLIAVAKNYFPNVDFSKYYDAQEVMEALGAQLAKKEGYDAIWQKDQDPAFSEFVGLTNNAMTPSKTKQTEAINPETGEITSGTETPQAQQATQEGQETPTTRAEQPVSQPPSATPTSDTAKTEPTAMGGRPGRGKPNIQFNYAKNTVQALGVVAKTGNAFQRLLARKLMGFVGGVTFNPVIEGEPLPAALLPHADMWSTARALYVRDPATGKRHIFVRSSGNNQGINNIDVLHEALHAATMQKMYLGFKSLGEGFDVDSKLAKLMTDIQDLMKRAEAQYEKDKAAGKLHSGITGRIDSVKDIFTNPYEFLAYGMSDENVQDFLHRVEGIRTNESGFSSFVKSIMNVFGFGKQYYNGFSDLIDITGGVLESDKTSKQVAAERKEINKARLANVIRQRNGVGAAPTAAATSIQPSGKQAVKDMTTRTNQGLKAVADSRAGNDLGKAVSYMQMLRDPREIWSEAKLLWGSMTADAREIYSHALDREGIAEQFGDRIPALIDINKAAQKMTGQTQNLLRGAANMSDEIVRFQRAHPKFVDQFEDLRNLSTYVEYDPSLPVIKDHNKEIDNLYNTLPEQGKKLYVSLKNYYSHLNDFQNEILEEQLDALDLPEEERKKLMKGLRETIQKENKIEPYFQLDRQGDYVLEYGRGKSRVALRFDTQIERDRAKNNYLKTQNETEKELRDRDALKTSHDKGGLKLRAQIEGVSKILKTAYEAIDSADMKDPRAKTAMKDEIYQAVLTSMPEASIRKMFIHRKGTPGFTSNILRTVNNTGVRFSTQLARLKYSPEMRRGLEAAQRALEGQEDLTPIVKRMTEFVNESIQPTQKTDATNAWDKVAGGIAKLAFLRYLTSWSSALMQPMDIFLKGWPILASHGAAKGTATLLKNLALLNQYGVVETMPDGSTRYHAPSIEFAKGLSPMKRRAVREMKERGVTTNTLENEVYSQAKKPYSKVSSKAVQTAKDVAGTLILGGLMHHMERLSREVIYLSSFEMAMDGKPLTEENYQAAADQATRDTNEAFGNYDPDNKPMIMRGGTGKIVTMYKFFPLITTKLLITNFFKMLPLFKEGKKQAAIKFFGVMGTHLLLGGVVALPAFSLVMSMLGLAWKKWGQDPDAPEDMKSLDYETWWRTEYLPEMLGNMGLNELSRLVETGVLNRITGLDVSSRLSLNDMWFRDPAPGHTIKESIANIGLLLGGPAANMALSAMQGIQLLADGDYEQGIEKLVPGSIGNLIAAHRYAKEGYQDYQGAQMVEAKNVPTKEIIGKAIGYAPAAIADTQTKAFKEAAVTKQILTEKASIQKKLIDAFRKANDPALSPEKQERFDQIFIGMIDKMADFNVKHPENAFDDEEVQKAIDASYEKRGIAETFGGVNLTEKTARIGLPVAEHNVETLQKAYGK